MPEANNGYYTEENYLPVKVHHQQGIIYATIDADLLHDLKNVSWTIDRYGGHYGYPRASVKTLPQNVKNSRRSMSLHQLVWQLKHKRLPENPLTIDHINRNKMDSRIGNLRIATKSMQMRNR